MRILILEDNAIRIREFRMACNETIYVDFVNNVNDLSNKIEKNRYDLIFLDHDLDGLAFVNPRDYNTGTTAAYLISTSPLNKDRMVIIHSHNPEGARSMIRHLPMALHIPFMNLNIDQIIKYQKENIRTRGAIG
jgi:CheY-like chemotaxis protein